MMQTVNYNKSVYKRHILGFLFLLTACDPGASKALDQVIDQDAKRDETIQLAEAVAIPAIQEALDKLNALDLKNPETIRKMRLIMNSLNSRAWAYLQAQANLQALKDEKTNNPAGLQALKNEKRIESQATEAKLTNIRDNVRDPKNDLMNSSGEEREEYIKKIQPFIDSQIALFRLVDKIEKQASNIWDEISQFQ